MLSTKWRLRAVDQRGDGVRTIASLHLYAEAVREDGAATITAGHTPISGALSNIAQAVPGAGCSFSAAQTRSPGFYIQWEFPAAVDISGMRLASTALTAFSIYAFVGSEWLLVRVGGVIAGLSTTALSPLLPFVSRASAGSAVLFLAGAALADGVTGTAWVASGGAVVQSNTPRGGVTAGVLSENGMLTYPAAVPAFTNWVGGDVTVEAVVMGSPPCIGNIPLTVFMGSATASAAYWSFGVLPGGRLAFEYWGNGEFYAISAPGVVDTSRPTAIAVSVQNKTLRLFVNGKVVQTLLMTTMPISSGNVDRVRIGVGDGRTDVTRGTFLVSDVLLTASAKYTADYTVSDQWATTPLVNTVVSGKAIKAVGAPTNPQGLGAVRTNSGNLKTLDMEFGGVGRIYGTVAIKNTPTNMLVSRRVRLFRSRDGLLVAETWSKTNGEYEFKYLTDRYEYDVEAWDHTLHHRSVIANNLVPEVA